MIIFKKARNRIAMFLWKGNPWTVCVDQVEDACKAISKGELDSVTLVWKLSFMPEPNKFAIRVQKDERNNNPIWQA